LENRNPAGKRNRFLLDRCDEVLLLYASPGGKTDRLMREALDRGLPVSVLEHPANIPWLDLGATVWRLATESPHES